MKLKLLLATFSLLLVMSNYAQTDLFQTINTNGASTQYIKNKKVDANEKKGKGYFKIKQKEDFAVTLIPIKSGGKNIGLDVKSISGFSIDELYCSGAEKNSTFLGESSVKGITKEKGFTFFLIGNYFLTVNSFRPETNNIRAILYVYIKDGEPGNVPVGVTNEELKKCYTTNSAKDFEKINFNVALGAYFALKSESSPEEEVEEEEVVEEVVEEVKVTSTAGSELAGGFTIVEKNNMYIIEDADGRSIIDDKYNKIIYDEGCDAFLVYNGSKWGLIDKSGQTTLGFNMEAMETTPFNNVKCKIKDFHFLTNKNNSVRSGIYDKIYAPQLNHFIVEKKGKFGIIDGSGMELAAPNYEKVYYNDDKHLVIEHGGIKYVVDYTKPFELPSTTLAKDFENYHDYRKAKTGMTGLTKQHRELGFAINHFTDKNPSINLHISYEGKLQEYSDKWFDGITLKSDGESYGSLKMTDHWGKQTNRKILRDPFNPAVMIVHTGQQYCHLVYSKEHQLVFWVDFEEKISLKKSGVAVETGVSYIDYTKGAGVKYIMGVNGNVPSVNTPFSDYEAIALKEVTKYQMTFEEAMKLEAEMHLDYINQQVHAEGSKMSNPVDAKTIKMVLLADKSSLNYWGEFEIGLEVLTTSGKALKTKNLGGTLDFAAFNLYSKNLEYAGNGVFKIPSFSNRLLLTDNFYMDVDANVRGKESCKTSKRISLDFDRDLSLDLGSLHYVKSKYTKYYPNYYHRIETMIFNEYQIAGETVYSVEFTNFTNNSVSYDSEDDLVIHTATAPYFFSKNSKVAISAMRKGSTKFNTSAITNVKEMSSQLSISYVFEDDEPDYETYKKQLASGKTSSSSYSSSSSSSSNTSSTATSDSPKLVQVQVNPNGKAKNMVHIHWTENGSSKKKSLQSKSSGSIGKIPEGTKLYYSSDNDSKKTFFYEVPTGKSNASVTIK